MRCAAACIAMVIPNAVGDRAHRSGRRPVHAGQALRLPQRPWRDQRRGGGAHPQGSPHRRLERLRGLYGTKDQRRQLEDHRGGGRRHRRAHRHARGKGSKALDYPLRPDARRSTWANSASANRRGGGSIWFAPVSQAKGSETLSSRCSSPKRILGKHGFDYVRRVHRRLARHAPRDRPAVRPHRPRADEGRLRLLRRGWCTLAEQGYGVYRTSTGVRR